MKTILTLLGASCMLAHSAVLSVTGSFEYSFDQSHTDYQGIPLLSGDYSFTFDDSAIPQTGIESFSSTSSSSNDIIVLSPTLSSFSLDQQIGTTSFDQQNMSITYLGFWNGVLVNYNIAGVDSNLYEDGTIVHFIDSVSINLQEATYSVGSVSGSSTDLTSNMGTSTLVSHNYTITPIPEPNSLGLLGLGAFAVISRRKRV